MAGRDLSRARMIAQLPNRRKLRHAMFHVEQLSTSLEPDAGGSTWNLRAGLFADAEPGEDFAQQVVGRELAGDGPQRFMRQPQFFGIEL